jgi:hypothetical protein
MLSSKGGLPTAGATLDDCQGIVEDVTEGFALHVIERALGSSHNRTPGVSRGELALGHSKVLVDPPQMPQDSFLEQIVSRELHKVDGGRFVKDLGSLHILGIVTQGKQVTLSKEPVQATLCWVGGVSLLKVADPDVLDKDRVTVVHALLFEHLVEARSSHAHLVGGGSRGHALQRVKGHLAQSIMTTVGVVAQVVRSSCQIIRQALELILLQLANGSQRSRPGIPSPTDALHTVVVTLAVVDQKDTVRECLQ